MLLIRNKTLRQCMGILETFNLLLIRLTLKNRSKARAFPGRVFREYMALVKYDRWRCQDIHEILPATEGIRITVEYLPTDGITTPVDELAFLALITKALKPKQIFEIGTFRGRTALNFALNSPDDCVVWTLDLPPEQRESFLSETNSADAGIIRASQTGIDYQGKDVTAKIRQLYGNSLTFDFTPYRETIDLVFVDGAHHYMAALSDTKHALQMVRPGGYVVWHDFANYGDYHDVIRAILDLLPGDQITQIANTQLALFRRPHQ